MSLYSHVSTGWKSLDGIIDCLRRGDNVVWQVDGIDDYQRLTTLFVNDLLSKNERVIYMRFARHLPLLEVRSGISIYRLNVANGFESFSAEVHSIIAREGRDACYVFDCLSDLLFVWATDLMIGNFFFITCPYLFELNTVAYFAILRNRHSYQAIARIRETTQVLIDVYNYEGRLCVHPLKVQSRYSPTMFFPHLKEKDRLTPVINSVSATRLFSRLSRNFSADAHRQLDYWDRLFIRARELLESSAAPDEKSDMVEQLSRLMLTRNKRMLSLIRDCMDLEDLLDLKRRLIGTGFVGGKTLGMILARKMLATDARERWKDILEPHYSFVIGSDVFYSYVVQNGWWKLFMAHKTREGYFEKARLLKEKMRMGVFPEEIREQFQRMLEYFGQSPIIVRSSSLLEDALGSAFAGKYESHFCVNQGAPEKRYGAFEEAVRRIFASTMNEDALTYRMQRGLDQVDEQMALLVQRVSGAYHRRFFFPAMAGVGLSYNPYVWKKGMDAGAGMLRLVFGLGTRAVDRVGNDYPRIVAIQEPLIKPLSEMKEIRKFSQRHADVLHLEENGLQTLSIPELSRHEELDAQLALIGVKDVEAAEFLKKRGKSGRTAWILTFDRFLTETPFAPIMGKLLRSLEKRYGNPVEIEFTVNFNEQGEIRINLLQCRPFFNPMVNRAPKQGRSAAPGGGVEETSRKERIVVQTEGTFMGGSVFLPISRIVFVDPEAYVALSVSDKFSVARMIGKINRSMADRAKTHSLLLGPGRWGTRTPAMGVPVSFSEISRFSAIGEISYRSGDLIPDLSFGTHFFHDLVETGIFYMAIYPENKSVVFDADWIRSLPEAEWEPGLPEKRLKGAVKVAETEGLVLFSDIAAQKTVCRLQTPSQAPNRFPA